MAIKSTRKVARSNLGRVPLDKVKDRHNRILDAATAVFLERGFSGGTVTEIAKRADCSLQTLYQEFPTKAKMFAALTTRRSMGLFEAVGPLNPERGLREALLRFATEVLALMMRPDVKNLHRVVIAESRAFPELARNFWKEGAGSGIRSLTDFFEAKRVSGEMTIGDSKRAAEVFVALVLGMINMRSVVGLKTHAESKKEQSAWADYSVRLFMTLVEAKAF